MQRLFMTLARVMAVLGGAVLTLVIFVTCFSVAGRMLNGFLHGGVAPPSVILVIYAILTEQNIAKLFLSAFIPGILAAVGYMLTIAIYVRVNPSAAGLREPIPMSERFRALMDVWPVLLVFLLVVGGIYLGWFTPTEGAAVGVNQPR